MRVLFIEPFYGGSHRAFADGLKRHSRHRIELLTLPEGEWRRRMRRGAQELALAAGQLEGTFDLVIATDMLDVPTFLALTRPRFERTPLLYYLHENQFTYPRIRGTKLNSWFGQINYLSALAVDRVAFNSEYHRQDFLGALRTLSAQPNNWLVADAIGAIESKSAVIPIGVELSALDRVRPPDQEPSDEPLILWNHRWEFDKGPEMFARVVERLAADGVAFKLAVVGQPGATPSPILETLPERLGARIVQFGFAGDFQRYAELLWKADLVVSTTRHEFFGVGMVEAMYCGCVPCVPARFTYPFLVPAELHDCCLYESEAEFEARLRALIERRPGTDAVRQSAERFRWELVAEQWDGQLQRMYDEFATKGSTSD